MFAAPTAIGFSRAVLSGVAAAIGLVFLMSFFTPRFARSVKADAFPPRSQHGTPNIFFAAIGLLLLNLQATNRETRSLNPFATERVRAS